MNKTEFLEQLERLLWDISCQEREEALDFYRSYFEDAGEENEAQVIQELGSPGKVAAIIKADLEDGREGTGEEHGEYTESGYQDERFREDHVPEKAQEIQKIQKIQRIPEEASRVPIPITAIQEGNTDTRKAEYPGRLSL